MNNYDCYITALKKCIKNLLNEINQYEIVRETLSDYPEAQENLDQQAKVILQKGLLIHERQQELGNKEDENEL